MIIVIVSIEDEIMLMEETGMLLEDIISELEQTIYLTPGEYEVIQE